jgi:uncharacterized protein YyaL (SSP411 family)
MNNVILTLPAIGGQFLLLLLIGFMGCQNPANRDAEKNHLADAQSPYLQQHADNPVHWYPWGEEALQRAAEENKPLIISIGYAACHWCHVMERETFKNDSIADFMNAHFINIKVDREERPDIDQIYMNAVQLMTGSGGWPLNAIALPGGEPFFAGTYFTPEQWWRLLTQIQEMYEEDPEKLRETAEKVKSGIAETDLISTDLTPSPFSKDTLNLKIDEILKQRDDTEGGFQSQQKFPLPMAWQFLIDVGYLTASDSIQQMVTHTLDQMLSGGLYDHIGGGFARYTVDPAWKIPHFEKMLYDNGQLMSLYARAFAWTRDSTYLQVVKGTAEFLDRELQATDVPAFYASIDAESEHEEGAFYIWTWEELTEHFSAEELNWLKAYYAFSPEGNWEEGKNIVWQGVSADEIAANTPLSPRQMTDTLESLRQQLFTLRAQRERPKTDDKILTSWNALTIQGYVDAYRATRDEDYLQQAEKTADFLWQNMQAAEEGALFRSYKDGEARISAFLDDYAFFIQSLLSLYEVTFDDQYLDRAEILTEYAWTHFADEESPFFYYTSAQDNPLIVRKFELTDNVQPSSNSTMANNLFKLGHLLDRSDWVERSKLMLQLVLSDNSDAGYYFAHWYRLYALITHDFFEVAIVGSEADSLRTDWLQYFAPNAFLLGGEDEGDLPLLKDKKQDGVTMIYVCKEKVCRLPVPTAAEAWEELQSDW